VPTLWREQKNHVDDYYFCSMNVVGINAKKLARYKYPDVSSVSKPVPRTASDPLPICPGISAKNALRPHHWQAMKAISLWKKSI